MEQIFKESSIEVLMTEKLNGREMNLPGNEIF